ncbi:hypothetical protein [Streptomyces sp. SP18CS02]|uniref:hypothetical protein n=1 Tax=Streptomyces sp. SP18CS02 TaxID=3002531 RepID=UPI002E7A5FE6|nr:hypothetical protein [Streptomyces sp. SP18CS02]MEE1753411.1 hypothetical protein [Streptomyces sp. SP18CS02]
MFASATDAAPGGRIARMLESPVVGMSPWIAFSVLAGPGRFEIAVVVSLALAVALLVGGRAVRRGSSVKLLEVADVVFFAAMAIVGIVASEGTYRWLETYAGELSNIALVLIAFGSMAVRMPFTLPYARERADRKHGKSPEFLRANYVITGAWGVAFLVAAIAGGFGDLVLRNSNNLWTGWIIQIVAIIAALRFTEWYPQVVRARLAGEPEPPVRSLLIPFVGLLIPIGVVVLVFDAAASWFGVGLMILGVILARALRSDAAITHHHRRRLK